MKWGELDRHLGGVTEVPLGSMSAPGSSGGGNTSLPRLPWEGPGMTALALGTADPEPWLFVPPLPSPAPPLPLMGYPAARPPLVEHRAQLAKRRKLYASLVDGNSDDQRAVQLARWLELIEMGLDCSKIGSQIREYQKTAVC